MGVDLLEFDQKQDLKVLVKYGCYDNTFLEKLSFSPTLKYFCWPKIDFTSFLYSKC